MAIATERPDEFHAERRTGIGGSDAAAVCGVSEWRTPLDVFREKLDLAPPIVETPAMRWGNLLEDKVAEEYSHQTGHPIRRDRRMLRHKAHPFMVCHLDRRVPNSDRIVEVKTVGPWASRDAWGEAGTDEIPPYYLTQAHHNMIVAGAKVCDVPVLIGGQDFRVYTVRFDQGVATNLIEIEREFWRKVEAHEAPDDPLNQFVRDRFPFSRTETKVGGDTEAQLLVQLLDVQEQVAALQEQRDTLERELCVFLGEADQLKIGRRIVAKWKTQQSNRVDVAELRAKFPDLAQALTKAGSSRPFRLDKKAAAELRAAAQPHEDDHE